MEIRFLLEKKKNICCPIYVQYFVITCFQLTDSERVFNGAPLAIANSITQSARSFTKLSLAIISLWLSCNIIRKFNYMCVHISGATNLYTSSNEIHLKQIFLMLFFDCKYLHIIHLLLSNDLESPKYLKSDTNVVHLTYPHQSFLCKARSHKGYWSLHVGWRLSKHKVRGWGGGTHGPPQTCPRPLGVHLDRVVIGGHQVLIAGVPHHLTL